MVKMIRIDKRKHNQTKRKNYKINIKINSGLKALHAGKHLTILTCAAHSEDNTLYKHPDSKAGAVCSSCATLEISFHHSLRWAGSVGLGLLTTAKLWNNLGVQQQRNRSKMWPRTPSNCLSHELE